MPKSTESDRGAPSWKLMLVGAMLLTLIAAPKTLIAGKAA